MKRKADNSPPALALWHDQGLSHGLAIADSLRERLRWSEYFCHLGYSPRVQRTPAPVLSLERRHPTLRGTGLMRKVTRRAP